MAVRKERIRPAAGPESSSGQRRSESPDPAGETAGTCRIGPAGATASEKLPPSTRRTTGKRHAERRSGRRRLWSVIPGATSPRELRVRERATPARPPHPFPEETSRTFSCLSQPAPACLDPRTTDSKGWKFSSQCDGGERKLATMEVTRVILVKRRFRRRRISIREQETRKCSRCNSACPGWLACFC